MVGRAGGDPPRVHVHIRVCSCLLPPGQFPGAKNAGLCPLRFLFYWFIRLEVHFPLVLFKDTATCIVKEQGTTIPSSLLALLVSGNKPTDHFRICGHLHFHSLSGHNHVVQDAFLITLPL